MSVDPKYLHSDITHSILQAFYAVYKRLPYGLAITVYKKALKIEFDKLGLITLIDKEVSITYERQVIGTFIMDYIVNNLVMVKIISGDKITSSHALEVKNYLQVSDYEVCLILNFAIEGEHKRIVYTKDIKKTDKT